MADLYMIDFSIIIMQINYVSGALALANTSMKNHKIFIRNSNSQYIKVGKINYNPSQGFMA